ncbi:MAG: TPR end-of-group domain-containing protein [Planctomycetota bacterium]
MTARNRIRRKRIERHAEGYLELEMPQHALEALEELGEAVELSGRASYLRGEALRAMERYQEAVEPLRRASQLDPGNTHVWLALGWCYKRTARIDLAVEAMERATESEPSDALVHYNLACYLSLAGKKEKALAHLSQALAIDSHYRELAHEEPDFDPIRSDPEFQALTSIIV